MILAAPPPPPPVVVCNTETSQRDVLVPELKFTLRPGECVQGDTTRRLTLVIKTRWRAEVRPYVFGKTQKPRTFLSPATGIYTVEVKAR